MGLAFCWQLLKHVNFPKPRGSDGLRYAALAMLTIILSNPFKLFSTVTELKPQSHLAVNHAQMQFLRDNTPEDAIIFSDQSMYITWYAGRRSIRHHYTVAADGSKTLALLEFDREFVPIDAAFFSGKFLRNQKWREMYDNLKRSSEFKARFACKSSVDPGAVFCTRRS
jgi:hypothetical protein